MRLAALLGARESKQFFLFNLKTLSEAVLFMKMRKFKNALSRGWFATSQYSV
jgi:hypothetical protein